MNRHYETWTIEEYEHAKELRARGLTYHQIGEKMGLSCAAVYHDSAVRLMQKK